MPEMVGVGGGVEEVGADEMDAACGVPAGVAVVAVMVTVAVGTGVVCELKRRLLLLLSVAFFLLFLSFRTG